MNRNVVRLRALAAAALFVAACAPPGGSEPSPGGSGAATIDGSHRVALPNSLSPLVRGAEDLGRLEATTRMGALSLRFRLTDVQQVELDALLARQHDPSSADYQQWLSPEEYRARFGVTPDEEAKVGAWLAAEGFDVNGVSRGGRELRFAGTTAQVEATFATEIHTLSLRGEARYANVRALQIPSELADLVADVGGVDDLLHAGHVGRGRPEFSSASGRTHLITPNDLSTIYGVQGARARGLDGTGVSIAVVERGYYQPSDLSAFRAAAGLPVASVTDVLVPGSGAPGDLDAAGIGEQDLDVEYAGALAPAAQLFYVYTGHTAGYDVDAAINYVINNRLATLVSSSWTWCEQPGGFATWWRSMYQQANAEGITVVNASGDSGSAACDPAWGGAGSTASHGKFVTLPPSYPEVTGAGGTTFNEGTGTYWGTNDAGGGSALSYIPEVGWKETGKPVTASGGGASALFGKPAWQTGVGVPNDGHRDVPDFALSAAAGHDGYLMCLNGSCVNGWLNAVGGASWAGGTSAVAPAFTGMLALLVQATGSAGLGNINPMLYGLAAHPTNGAFNDVVAGDNIVPCAQGSLNCPASAPFQYGYVAGPGYDQVTGLGSVNFTNLLDAWQAAAPIPNLFTMTTSGTTTLNQGASTTITVTTTVSSGSSQFVQLALSGLPTGASYTVSANPVVSGQAATLTINTGAAAAGTYALSLTGTAPGGTRTSALSLKIVADDFRLTASPTTVSVRRGNSGTVTISSALTSGASQTLTFSVSGQPSGVTASFSPATLTVGSSTHLTLQVGSSAPVGTYALTITGAGPYATRTVPVTLKTLQ